MMGSWQRVLLLFALLSLGVSGAAAGTNTTQFDLRGERDTTNSTEVKTATVKILETPSIFLLTTLEVADSDIDTHLEKIKDTKKKTNSKLIKMSKIGQGIKKFVSMFSVMSGFLSLLSVVTTTSDLQAITDMFVGVNKKLDKISDQLDKLDDSVELQGLLSNYIPWQYSVANGIEKLVETYSAMSKVSDINRRRIIAENFILFFENNQIGSNINNLMRITTASDTIQQTRLFDELIEKSGCDIIRLTNVYLHVKRIFTRGCQLVQAYHAFKQMEPPSIQKYLDALVYIRTNYESRVWHCKETSIIRSKNEIVKEVKRDLSVGILKLLGNINNVLSKKFPWYSWSIVNIKRLIGSGSGATSGNQYYEMEAVGSYGWNLAVTWQGTDEKSQCQDIGKSNTVIFLSICKGCHTSRVSISKDMLSKNKCPASTYPEVKAFINQRGSQLAENTKKADSFWVAAGFKSPENPCGHRCNNHGECKIIPYTDQFQCLCQSKYEGEKCELKIEMNENIMKLVSVLQLGYKNAFKVPSLANVLIQGENLSKQLKKMMQRMDNQFELTQILIKYIRDLQKLDYVLKLSFSYSKQKISIDAFSRRMKKFLSLNPINFIFQQLSNAIMADGFTDTKGKDFFNTFKQIIASDRDACTKEYGNEARKLFDRLSQLDITAAEAILAYYHFESNYLTAEHMKTMKASAKQLVRDSKRRMRNYARYWERTSCPALNVTYLRQNGCSDMLSFEGMRVKLSCVGGRAAEPQNIQCVNSNGKLQWSAIPRCLARWSAWSQWTPCAATCGEAVQSRRRTCQGESDSDKCQGQAVVTRKCFMEDCCHEKLGKFRCDNSTCLRLSQVCDGIDDCLDGSDESSERCRYLRSGDRIALRNMDYSQDWISVQYTDYVQANLYYGRAYLDHCISGDQVSDGEWKNCPGQSMLIYGNYENGKTGKAIRYGDKIALYYRKTNFHYRWFRCYTTYCMTFTCDKVWGKFDFGPKGGCKEYEFDIKNYDDHQAKGPVKAGDVVVISNSNGAVRGNGYYKEITQSDCAKKREKNINMNCKASGWQVYIK